VSITTYRAICSESAAKSRFGCSTLLTEVSPAFVITGLHPVIHASCDNAVAAGAWMPGSSHQQVRA
jgi:V8-like Glu-specific endopeptidase